MSALGRQHGVWVNTMGRCETGMVAAGELAGRPSVTPQTIWRWHRRVESPEE